MRFAAFAAEKRRQLANGEKWQPSVWFGMEDKRWMR